MGEEHEQDDKKFQYITTTNLYILFSLYFLLLSKFFFK